MTHSSPNFKTIARIKHADVEHSTVGFINGTTLSVKELP